MFMNLELDPNPETIRTQRRSQLTHPPISASVLHLGDAKEREEEDGEGGGDAGVPDVEEEVGQGRGQARPLVIRVPQQEHAARAPCPQIKAITVWSDAMFRILIHVDPF